MAERDIEYYDANEEKRPKKLRVDPKEGGVPNEFPSEVTPDDLIEAGWSDDPGTGIAVLLEDGREVLNPTPMAPPIGYQPQDTLMELMSKMLKNELDKRFGDMEVDTPEDAEDFGEDDELSPFSGYEIAMADEFPAIPRGSDPGEPPPPEPPPIEPPTVEATPKAE